MGKNESQPVVRISTGKFAPEKYADVKRLVEESATPLVPAIKALPGLFYYYAAVDPNTATVMNVSIWASLKEARQMETLAPMLAQRPILESAGVHFDAIANYTPLWSIGTGWSVVK